MRLFGFFVALFILSVGAGAALAAEGGNVMTMKIESSAFKEGGAIPILDWGSEGQKQAYLPQIAEIDRTRRGSGIAVVNEADSHSTTSFAAWGWTNWVSKC